MSIGHGDSEDVAPIASEHLITELEFAAGNALTSTVAVPAGGRLVVVVAAPSVVRVELIRGSGNVLAFGLVEGGIASLPEGLDGTVRALDPAGNEVGTPTMATLPTPSPTPSTPPRLENW